MRTVAISICFLVALHSSSRSFAGGTPSIEELAKVLTDTDKSKTSKLEAMTTLRRHGARAKPAIPALKATIAGKDQELRWAALLTFGAIGEPAVGELTELLQDRDLRVGAAKSLGQIGKPAKRAVPALLEGMRSDDNAFAEASILALNLLGPPPKEYVVEVSRIIDKLDGLLKKNRTDAERYMAVPGAALQGLAAIGLEHGAAAVPALVRLLETYQERPYFKNADKYGHFNHPFVGASIKALSTMGPAAKEAIPTLRKYLNDKMYGPLCEKAIEQIKSAK